jgi:structural maintenance of chromosome 4
MFRNQTKPLSSELARHDEVKKLIMKNGNEIQALMESAAEIEAVIKDLQEKILEVGGVKFRSQKAVVDGIQEQISTQKDRIAKLKVEKASRERNMGKLNSAIESKGKEVEDLDTEMNNIKSTLDSQLASAASVRAEVTEAKNLLLDKETLMENLKEKIDSNTEVVNEIRRNAVSFWLVLNTG